MLDQERKGKLFQDLHTRDSAFIIPNPWDVGTARLLAHLGFDALATTSADLENGYVKDPETVAETIQLAASSGLVACSIEDATTHSDKTLYELPLAVERMRAAAEVVRSLPCPFMLTGRAENFLVGRPDLKDTIKRLQAYQEAGADLLYAPGINSKDDIVTIIKSVDRPVNVIMGLQGLRLSLAEFSSIGVKRVSIGSALSRAALGAFLSAAIEMKEHGTFDFSDKAVSFSEISNMF